MLSELTMIKIYSDNNLLKLITTMATTVENRGGFSFLSILRSIITFYCYLVNILILFTLAPKIEKHYSPSKN